MAVFVGPHLAVPKAPRPLLFSSLRCAHGFVGAPAMRVCVSPMLESPSSIFFHCIHSPGVRLSPHPHVAPIDHSAGSTLPIQFFSPRSELCCCNWIAFASLVVDSATSSHAECCCFSPHFLLQLPLAVQLSLAACPRSCRTSPPCGWAPGLPGFGIADAICSPLHSSLRHRDVHTRRHSQVPRIHPRDFAPLFGRRCCFESNHGVAVNLISPRCSYC